MNFKELEKLGVKEADVMLRFMGNRDLYDRILSKFLSDGTYYKFKEAEARGEFEKMFGAAHTLKGVSANLGLTFMEKYASDIVEQLRWGTPKAPELLKESIQCLDREYAQSIEVLQNL